MQFLVNLMDKKQFSPIEKGHISFLDETSGTQGVGIAFTFSPSESILRAIDDEGQDIPDLVSLAPELAEGTGPDDYIWAITPRLGLVDNHRPEFSIMAFEDAFLVCLLKGQINLEEFNPETGKFEALPLDYGYSGSNADRVTFISPHEFVSAPWRTPVSRDSVHHISYKWRNWGPQTHLESCRYEASLSRVAQPFCVNQAFHDQLVKERELAAKRAEAAKREQALLARQRKAASTLLSAFAGV